MSKKTKSLEEWAKKLAATMKLLRELKGKWLREHARDLGMSPATLSRIERGYGCDVATILHIHEQTGVKVETLMGLTNQ